MRWPSFSEMVISRRKQWTHDATRDLPESLKRYFRRNAMRDAEKRRRGTFAAFKPSTERK